MSREHGEILCASLHPVYSCVSFPRKVSNTAAAELEPHEPDVSQQEGHLASESSWEPTR